MEGPSPTLLDVAVSVTYNGQTYGVPYAVESVAPGNNALSTKDEPKTLR